MNWKTNIQVRDLDQAQRIEFTCQSCRHVRFASVVSLIKARSDSGLYVDEIEVRERCGHRGCTGRVMLALLHQDKVSGFVGGMA